MSWREVIGTATQYSHNPHKSISEDTGNIGVKESKSNSSIQPDGCKSEKHNSDPYDHNSQYTHKDEMPSRPELERICRRAVADYPDVSPDQLRRFLEVAEDPEWCSERVARHIARRMSEGLIVEAER